MTHKLKQSGFTAVELLVTLFVAAAFLVAGYQLYNLIIKDSGETRAQSRASNAAYDYLQRYKPAVTIPCTVQTPLSNQSISVANLSNVTVTVAITCPYSATTSVSKILVTLQYNTPQRTVSNATYVTQ
jgi:prepilin-type N-terminal cleavage/methylation domain-containing protein